MTSNLYLSLLLSTLVTSAIIAQNSGRIAYVEDVTFELPPHIKAQFKDMGNSRKSNKTLTWKGTEANYIVKPEEGEMKRRRNTMIIRENRKSIMYCDYASDQYVLEKEVMRKEFSIVDSLPQYEWKIVAAKQREILGYTCIKAMSRHDTTDIVAWWTPQIPLSYGPDGIGGLPGMILAIGYGKDKAILAQEIELDPEEPVEITVLTSTKKSVSNATYKELMAKRREEMRAMWGGSRKRREMRQR